MKPSLFAAAAIALAGCAAPKTVEPLSLPLAYKMMATPTEFPAVTECHSLAGIKVKDQRREPRIGVRVLEEHPDQTADVNAASDVVEWVRAGFEAGLSQSGLAVGGGSATLNLVIDDLRTNENVLHRSGYDSRISLLAEVTRNGKTCWKGDLQGKASNYGYSGSVENYQEMLNHALDRAVIDLVDSSEFRRAACAC